MQTSTGFNVPDFFAQHARSLFWISGLIAIVFFLAGIYFEQAICFVIPFALLFIALVVLNFRTVFFLMLLVMPVSVESYIGSFGTDLPSEPIVMLLSVCAFLYLLLNKEILQQAAFKHEIVLLLVLMFAWSVFAAIFSTDVFLSVKYLLAKGWYLLGFFFLPLILLRDKRSIRLFFWCLFISTYLSVLYIIVQHGTEGFTFDTITDSVHPIYRNHVNYAVFITMLLPFIFIAKDWYAKSSVRHKIIKYSIPVFLAAIYLSYTRGAWLATGAMLAYLLVLRFNLTKYVLVFSAVLAIAFCVYILRDNKYLVYSPNYETTIYHDELSQHLTSTFEMEDMSTVERFYRWIAAVNLFKENPVVGVGPNNFVGNYKKYTVTAYETYISDNEEKSTVHNYFLLLLTEQGIPALLLYIVLIVVVLLTAQKAYIVASAEKKKYIAAIILCINVFLLNNTLSDLVEANKVGSLFFICLALLVNFSTNTIDVDKKTLGN